MPRGELSRACSYSDRELNSGFLVESEGGCRYPTGAGVDGPSPWSRTTRYTRIRGAPSPVG